jgi:hypothetical protein
MEASESPQRTALFQGLLLQIIRLLPLLREMRLTINRQDLHKAVAMIKIRVAL